MPASRPMVWYIEGLVRSVKTYFSFSFFLSVTFLLCFPFLCIFPIKCNRNFFLVGWVCFERRTLLWNINDTKLPSRISKNVQNNELIVQKNKLLNDKFSNVFGFQKNWKKIWEKENREKKMYRIIKNKFKINN